ncbi:hypothetical protein GCM10008957_10620 [Deinococcus ruber]|uniref:Aminoglycoside phosphotransferase domain-containing protein n=1 Tax=Deinococcus ruber TaxID=1848197 RepID=A0A918C0R2_9DEIO|nr:hypothetical protein GCM10008957_10620 [Deinococcus ruber]
MVAVIADPERGRVLAVAGQLPELQMAGSVYFGQGVTEAFGTLLGAELALLRRVAFRRLPDTETHQLRGATWSLDLLSDSAHGEWSLPADLPAEQRPWAEAALLPAPPARPLWQRSGGQAQLLAWLDDELAAQERPRSAAPQIIKHTQISFLARVPTAPGPLYFKAVPGFFRSEVPVTCWLSRELPGAAPPVLAADAEQGFLLLENGGEALNLNVVGWGFPDDQRGTWTPNDSRALLRQVAHLQRASEARLDDLRALGLRERGPQYVLTWLPRLLDGRYFHTAQEGGLSAEEAQRLQAMQPRLQAMLERLAASPVPLTLGHGDLHEGNVLKRQEHFTMIDWSDACITHPFLDANLSYLVPQEHAEAAADAYLDAWKGMLPPAELRALYRAGQQAGELFRALGYIDGIQLGVEDASEWGNVHLTHFRALLNFGSEG